MVDQIQFAAENVVIVADDLTMEVFHWSYTDSFSLPVAWAGVRIEPKKHDEVEVRFGRAKPPGQQLYGEDVTCRSPRSSAGSRSPTSRGSARSAEAAARAGR